MKKMLFIGFVMILGGLVAGAIPIYAIETNKTITQEQMTSDKKNNQASEPIESAENKSKEKGSDLLEKALADFVMSLSIVKAGAFAVAVLLIFVGMKIIQRVKTEDNPLATQILPLLSITFILPVLLILATLGNIGEQAVIGILGTIVGYIFGTHKREMPHAASSKQNESSVEK